MLHFPLPSSTPPLPHYRWRLRHHYRRNRSNENLSFGKASHPIRDFLGSLSTRNVWWIRLFILSRKYQLNLIRSLSFLFLLLLAEMLPCVLFALFASIGCLSNARKNEMLFRTDHVSLITILESFTYPRKPYLPHRQVPFIDANPTWLNKTHYNNPDSYNL